MIQIFLNIKFWLESITESQPREHRGLLSKLILNGGKIIVKYLVFFYLKCKHWLGFTTVSPLKSSGEGRPIVSLTSFPKRFNNLWMVLYCLYQQTILPEKIVVTLINSEVPGGFESLPKSLKYYANRGVEFVFVDENLKPHNKYFYTRQKYPSDIVITVDDDLLYMKDTIERLMEMHKKYPTCICANRGSEISIKDNVIDYYHNWRYVLRRSEPSNNIVALGFAGVLYPPSFNYKDLYDIDKIKKTSLSADDLWLKAMEILSDTKVVVGDYYAVPTTIPSSQQISLKKINRGIDNCNDKCMLLLQKEYDILSKIKSTSR